MWTGREEATGSARSPSELVVMEGGAVAAAMPTPAIANLNVTKSSKVHIGPKFVSVTQNVQNAEMLKGRFLGLDLFSMKQAPRLRCSVAVFLCWAFLVASGLIVYLFLVVIPRSRFLGLDLVSTKQARRLRCSVAVFVCWAFLVASGLIIYLIYVAMPSQRRLDIGLNQTWYLRRGDWQARRAYEISFLQLPVPYVIIGHTASNYCNQRYKCVEQMLGIQEDHLRRNLSDIGPNFLVGGSGYVFEGRGANVCGAMVVSWNSKSISIMFMGNYLNDNTDMEQIDHVNTLLDVLVQEGVLRSDYTLLGNCQVSPDTVSPGPHIMSQLHNFLHWNRANASRCLPRQQIFEND